MIHGQIFHIIVRVVAITLVLAIVPARAVTKQSSRWSVDVDKSSLETVLLHPERILADPDAFWETDTAYAMAATWHRNVDIPLKGGNYYEKWLKKIRGYADVPADERESHPAFEMLLALEERVPRYHDDALSLLDEFTPENALHIDSTVNFTTGTLSYGFMMEGQIVIDVLSRHYGQDVDRIFNLVTHETFHLGYGYNRHLRRETPLDDSFVYGTMLDALHNEGMATWVGYTARSIFPNADEEDYEMFDDAAEVERQRGELNRLFTLAKSVPTDSLRAIAWDVGVMKRAYYITGADMSRTIEKRLGREALVATIETGPLDFIDTYNSLVDEDQRIVTFDRPAGPDLLRRLKDATLADDRATFDTIAAEMAEHRSELPAQTHSCIERFGYGMTDLLKAPDWGVAIFELGTTLFPDDASSWGWLGWAYENAGDMENAARYSRRALEIDPENGIATRTLADAGISE